MQNDRVAKVSNDGLTVDGLRAVACSIQNHNSPAIKDDGLINDLMNHNVEVLVSCRKRPALSQR